MQLLHLQEQPVLGSSCQARELSFVAGEYEMTEYRFNTKKNEHFFCKHCGVRAFGVGNETPIGKMYGVNVGCLEGVTDEELSKVPITYIDGLNDRWQEAPTYFSHL